MNLIPKIEYTHPVDGATTIEFVYPPNGFDTYGDTSKYVSKISLSANGKYQTSFNYSEEEIKLTFIFITQAIKDAVQKFMDDFAGVGGKFDYYADKDVASFNTYEIHKSARKLRPRRTNPQDLYSFKIRFRRVK